MIAKSSSWGQMNLPCDGGDVIIDAWFILWGPGWFALL